MTASRDLRIQGISAFRAYVRGTEIELGSPKQRATFAMLALSAGATVSRAELIDGVWGESAPATAAGSLHTYISGLRRALGPLQDLLVSESSGYRLLAGRDRFDITRAEDTDDDWPAGTLLPGVPGPFADRARARLSGVRLHRLIERAERAGPEQAAGMAVRLAAEIPAHPLDERLRCALMSALHRGGRTAEALAQFEELRRALAAELGISPSPATQAVYAGILVEDRRRVEEPPAGESARPAQLPHDSDVFVGREPELLAVIRSPAEGRRIVMIVGVGGIGKTTLAVRAGHMLRDGYPDGQIHLNLRGFDPAHAALSTDEALEFLLASVGVRRMPATHDARVGLWRSRVAGKRLLVVLDNARDAAQIEDLLPGAGACLTVVTSRNRMSGLAVRHGARRITLGPLSESESLRLIGATIGAARVADEPEPARRLAALCDRSPFPLQIAAEQAGATPDARLAALAGELEDVRHRLDALQLPDDPLCSVRGVLSWSVAALGEDAARLFRLLGAFPGTSVTVPAAAALAGAGVTRAAELLGRLVELSLLDRAGDRFTIHDLTHAYAMELARALDPDEREAAVHRVTDWYYATLLLRFEFAVWARETASEAYDGVPPVRFHSERDYLRWCEAERQNILALIVAADHRGLYGLACSLALLLLDYFYLAGRPLEWLETLRVGLHAAELSGNDVGRAHVLSQRALALARLGQADTAVRQLRQGLAVLEGRSDRGVDPTGLSIMQMLVLLETRHYAELAAVADEGLRVTRAAGLDYYLAYAYSVVCALHAETGKWAEAVRHGLAGLEHARRSGSLPVQARLLLGLGQARLGLEELAEAERWFGEALRVSRRAGDRYHEGSALFGLARASVAEPGPLARRALAIFEELHVDAVTDVRAFLADQEC